MGKKESVSIERLKKLCDYDDTQRLYISKKGEDYLNALGEVFSLNNPNDRPFLVNEIVRQPKLKNFNFSGVMEYHYICTLHAKPMTIDDKNHRNNERIVADEFVDENALNLFKKSLGVSYLLTCLVDNEEYIIKIGQTRTTFEKRLQSYNCGCVYNWRTASTTNVKILQSFLATRLFYRLYLYDCSDEPYILSWHGEVSTPFASPKSLAVEDIMIKKFIEIFKQKPLANIQAEATSID